MAARPAKPEMKPLAEVIRELNERFGLDLGTGDEILVYQQVAGLVKDTEMQQVGLMNDEARFGQVADDRLDDIVAENAERNTEFMKLYFDNDEFRKAVKEAARRRAYRIITDPLREEALARLRAEMARETGVLGAALMCEVTMTATARRAVPDRRAARPRRHERGLLRLRRAAGPAGRDQAAAAPGVRARRAGLARGGGDPRRAGTGPADGSCARSGLPRGLSFGTSRGLRHRGGRRRTDRGSSGWSCSCCAGRHWRR